MFRGYVLIIEIFSPMAKRYNWQINNFSDHACLHYMKLNEFYNFISIIDDKFYVISCIIY